MNSSEYAFSRDKFSFLFPYYVACSSSFKVTAMGNYMAATQLLCIGDDMTTIFQLHYDGKPVAWNQIELYADCRSGRLSTAKHNAIFSCVVEMVPESGFLLICSPIHNPINQNAPVSAIESNWSFGNDETRIAELDFGNMPSVIESYIHQSRVLKQKEEELTNTTNRFTKLITNLQEAVLLEDEHRNLLLVNEAFLQMFGVPVPANELVGANCDELAQMAKALFVEEEQFVNDISCIISHREKVLNHVLELKDGRVLNRDYIPIFLGNDYKGHMWKYTDITDAHLFEKGLKQQKTFYEQILNEIPADIAVFDSNHRYLYVNPLGIKDTELRKWIIGKTDVDYCDYKGKDIAIAHRRQKIFADTAASKLQKEWEERMVKPDGTTEHVLRKMYPVYKPNGELDIMIGYGVNITESKRNEEKIIKSEIRYRSIFDNSLAMICTHDTNGIITDVNQTTLKTLGYSRNELVGYPLKKVIPANKRDDFDNHYIQEILANGKAEGIMLATNKTGQTLYLLYQNYLVLDDIDQPYVIGFSQNITQRIEAERALRKSEEKYRNIITNMNLGLLELDAQGQILFANNSYSTMSGYNISALLGRNIADVMPENQYVPLLKNATTTASVCERKVLNKDGEERWWLVSSAPSYDEYGHLNGSIEINLDISSQKLMEIELRKAKYDAEQSAQAKDIFLANISHEIRTPMNAIMGVGKLLAKTQLDSQQHTYLGTINTASNNLLTIINDLLDFSKIDAGKLSLEYIGFSLKAVIDNAIHILRYKLEEKGLQLNSSISEDLAPVLIGDPHRLLQVFMNLLTNAIKFTEKGSVTISCVVTEDATQYQQLECNVVDTGIGISDEFIAHIFEKFTQESAQTARKFGGTGLGMSITQELVHLMGGTIAVASTKNQGTTLTVKLKLNKGRNEDIPSAMIGSVDVFSLRGKRILVVEDNEMNRLLVNMVLSQYEAEITEANNGEAAIALVSNQTFDLILMDVLMPVKDGIETTKHIRTQLKLSVPIIALTANAFKKQEDICREAGMNDFLTKPFEENKLVHLVAKWLKIATVQMENKDAPIPNIEIAPFSLQKLKIISNDNAAFIRRMLVLFVNTIPENIKAMRIAAQTDDKVSIGNLAHKIKPSIFNLELTTIESEIKMLEQCSVLTDMAEVNRLIEKVERVTEDVIAGINHYLANSQL